MTYFSFLLRFLAVPLAVLLAVTVWDLRRGKAMPGFQASRAVWLAIGLHVLLAVLYTTPWDNYLVAKGVWSYRPGLVSGRLIGWVPVEEYTFFVLETLLAGLWWWFLARRLAPPREHSGFRPSSRFRLYSSAVLGLIWLGAVLLLITGWRPGTYLALILAWALPAFAPQLAFGADILWFHRKLVALTVFPLCIYLSAADSLAIASGTWTIDPARSTGVFFGALPLEEAAFFGVTVLLITFGLTLALTCLSPARWKMRLAQMSRQER